MCEACQKSTRRDNRSRALKPIFVYLPFDKWALYFMGPITTASRRGKRYILVATDYLTK